VELNAEHLEALRDMHRIIAPPSAKDYYGQLP
jgi:hypothetical protein